MLRLLVRLFVAAAVLAVGFYVFVWWYVNGAGFRGLVERAAAESLNAEVVIASLEVAPPLVVRARDVRVVSREGDARGGLRRLELEVVPWSLFSGGVVVRRLRLVGPEVVWRTGDALPAPAFAPEGSQASEGSVGSGGGAAVDGAKGGDAGKGEAQGADKGDGVAGGAREGSKRSLVVECVVMEEGGVRVLGADGGVLAELSGVGLEAGLRSGVGEGVSGRGRLRVERCVFPEGMVLGDVSGELVFDGRRLEVGEVKGDFFGGRVSGKFVADVDEGEFSAELGVVNFSLRKLAESRGQEAGGLRRARMSVFVEAEGSFAEPEELRGKGEFHAGPWELGEVPTVARLVVLLESAGVEGLRQLRESKVERVRGEFELRERAVHLVDVRSEPEDGVVLLEGSGRVGFDGKLDVRARLLLDARRAGLSDGTVALLGGGDGEGDVSVPFLVRGTTKEPVVSLDAGRLAGRAGAGLLQEAAEVVERVASPKNLEKWQREGERLMRALEGFFSPPRREERKREDESGQR